MTDSSSGEASDLVKMPKLTNSKRTGFGDLEHFAGRPYWTLSDTIKKEERFIGIEMELARRSAGRKAA